VIAIDTNILVYAHRTDAPFHDPAKNALREVVEGDTAWAIPWPCVHEFLSKVTHPRIFKHPTPLERALEQLEDWALSPVCQVISEPEGYLPILASTLRSSRTVGSQVHDARIAALCVAHGVDELWSADRDFSRFAKLRVRNPLND
jgi:toxin-antitoxin system PIN domain toxin